MQKFLTSLFASVGMLVASAFIAQTALATNVVTYTDVNVRIVHPETDVIYEGTVYVPSDGCTVTDNQGVEFDFSEPTALCALDLAALYGGFDYELINSSFGLYLNGIDGYTGEGWEYWSFYIDYQYATNGLADYVVESGDDILLSFGEYGNLPLKMRVKKKQALPGQTVTARIKTADDTGTLQPVEGATVSFGDTEVVTDADGYASYVVASSEADLEVQASYGVYTESNSAIVRTSAKKNKVKKVGKKKRGKRATKSVKYLIDQIDEDGLVSGSQSLTDWTAVALGSSGKNNKKVRSAVKAYTPTTEDGTNEIARNLIARAALDLPTARQVKRLKATVADGYVGEEAYINDEVFFILALQAADVPFTYDGYAVALNEIKEGANEDGGISYAKDATVSDVDTSAFLLQALNVVRGEAKTTGVKTKQLRRDVLYYLKNQQNVNGGWGYSEHQISNSSSTAVVLQAMKSSGIKPGRQMRNKRNGYNFLNRVQRKTGAVKYNVAGDQSLEELNSAYAIVAWSHGYLPVQ